ncbi:hypothetical protein [Nocardia altamirensis]|uniref:hypothetical protein n=1 Tax=Nocardia altamirensis TaxID=472158 RepID=UPI0008402411|nr:hypothetical protein [Nocardia altamirensis]
MTGMDHREEVSGCTRHAMVYAGWENRLDALVGAARPLRRATLRAAQNFASHCANCPVIAACRDRAQANRYTGIAGGKPFINGTAIATSTTSRRAA